ncbi:MAG: hypothetical protein RBT11_08500 [Desulfobacterales bacterium]|jgi:putative RNA 2'-phosphotransferase|nr:hypothetical protein [Desulfobacterales bacterium]
MNKRHHQESLAKLLIYILGRNPGEFGLVPDARGYVRIKDLLKAICEEDGWRHIRRSHLNEVVLVNSNPPIEIEGERVRAVDREGLPRLTVSEEVVKQLYCCIRKKAYAAALEKGVLPGADPFVILSDDRGMAERLGRRYDAAPVLLTVSVSLMKRRGLPLQYAGGTLYLAERIPPDCFTGPPLAKTREEIKSGEIPARVPVPKTPGSFFIERDDVNQQSGIKEKNVKNDDWKRARRQMNRRHKGKNKWDNC